MARTTTSAPRRGRAIMPVILHRRDADDQAEGRAVRAYLDLLRAARRRQGRGHTVAAIARRLAEIHHELAISDALTELRLIEERRVLREELATLDNADRETIEDAFVDVARSYSLRHGIDYGTWREVGVPAALLRRAGLRRGP